MKKMPTLLLILLCTTSGIFAQGDVIVCMNGDLKENTHVIEVGATEVKYKQLDDKSTTSHIYILQKESVFMIKYRDGSKVIFDDNETPTITENKKISTSRYQRVLDEAFSQKYDGNVGQRRQDKSDHLCEKAFNKFNEDLIDDCLYYYRDAIIVNPNNANAYDGLGRALMNIDRSKLYEQNRNDSVLFAIYAERALKKALSIEQYHPIYNLNMGAFYYYQGVELSKRMEAITDFNASNEQLWDNLKIRRDAFFKKALPYVDKAFNLLNERISNLSSNEQKAYRNSIMALEEIYSKTGREKDAQKIKQKYSYLY